MPTITEGNLQFSFPDDWKVVKYDETDFYRTVMPLDVEIRAIDFLVVPRPDFATILLIEVKDFRRHSVENRKRQDSGELINEVIKKAIDTLSGLYFAAYIGNVELQHFVNDDLLPPTQIELILFMEEDSFDNLPKIEQQNYKSRFQAMELKLKRTKSRLSLKSRMLNTSLLKLRDGFSVTHI